MQKFLLSGENLTIELAKKITDEHYEISLSHSAKERIKNSRADTIYDPGFISLVESKSGGLQ